MKIKPRIPFRKESFGGIAYDRENTRGGYYYLNETAYELLKILDESEIEKSSFTGTSLESTIERFQLEDILSEVSSSIKPRKRGRGNIEDYSVGFLSAPITVDLYPSFHCNERCLFCFAGDLVEKPPKSILKEENIPLLASALYYGGIFHVGILGGEPMLYPHFRTLVSELTKYDFHVSVASNGTLASDEILDLLYSQNININFSLQGPSAEIHDQVVRKKGAFEKSVRTIRKAAERGVSFLMSTVLNPINIGLATDIVELGAKLGAKDISFFFPERAGYTLRNRMEISFKEFVAALRSARKKGNELGIGVDSNCHFDFLLSENLGKFSPENPIAAYLYGDKTGKSRLDITPNGDVYPNFEFFGKHEWRMGNIFHDSMQDIWQSPVSKILENFPFPSDCQNCRFVNTCQGGFLSRRILKNLITKPDYCPLIDEQISLAEINALKSNQDKSYELSVVEI